MIDLRGYRNPALQFSGGKDSLACLYLLRDELDWLPVYWMNSGDVCDETLEVIEHVRPRVANFIEVKSDVKKWREQHGMPSDVVPQNCTELGVAYGLSSVRVSGRFECCAANRMLPMHERMVADGVDAVIRGTKLSDTGKLPAEGPTPWYTILLPLRNWSHQDVFDYLRSVGAPENPLYDHFKSASTLDCMGCTAIWDEGKAGYFAARHPERLVEYRTSLNTLRDELRRQLKHLDTELGED